MIIAQHSGHFSISLSLKIFQNSLVWNFYELNSCHIGFADKPKMVYPQ